MVIKPKIRGFVCITAHPTGCAAHVDEQIACARRTSDFPSRFKKVLILGASTGYGLSTRIAAAFGAQADTLGVFFERPSSNGRPASAGWYNTAALTRQARLGGRYAGNINGDAFSPQAKDAVVTELKNNMGPVDLVIYSLAAPRRTDPQTGQVYKSTLKPIGEPFTGKSVDTDKQRVEDVTIQPASGDEIEATRKVMGGEDWLLWMQRLREEHLLAEGAVSLAYSYIGPELTYPIYRHGTIGKAKEHLEQSAADVQALLGGLHGAAHVSVNKAVVTQASSAIPVVPLYLSVLMRVMKEKNIHEGTIEQMVRLFTSRLHGNAIPTDNEGRVRLDDWEMREDVQRAVKDIWPAITTENLRDTTDFESYQAQFLRLFGFGLPGVDYNADIDVEVPIPGIINLQD